MSTRIHWAGEDGHRFCTHGRTATHREGSAAEFLRLSNLCRTCERVAQKSEALSVLQAFGAGKPKRIPAPQWPEPRPIEEAPQEAILAWLPGDDEMEAGWEVCYPSKRSPSYWISSDGNLYKPTHFLPMPPKPEVRK